MPIAEFPSGWDPIYYRAQAVLQSNSGLAEDQIVNTWHFVGDDNGPVAGPAFTALQAFYTAVSMHLSGEVSRTGAVVKWYDLSVAAPNPPVQTDSLALVAALAGTLDMPRELATCMSFQGPILSGAVQRRRRGRIYFGPLRDDQGSLDYDRPSTTVNTALQSAGDALVTASKASSSFRWAVFSPTIAGGWFAPGGSGPPNLPGAVCPVDNGWVDNAWDVQRRRGYKATSRLTFS